MPPKSRKPDVCGDCFPDGWPADATAIGCIHGSWQRRDQGSE